MSALNAKPAKTIRLTLQLSQLHNVCVPFKTVHHTPYKMEEQFALHVQQKVTSLYQFNGIPPPNVFKKYLIAHNIQIIMEILSVQNARPKETVHKLFRSIQFLNVQWQ